MKSDIVVYSVVAVLSAVGWVQIDSARAGGFSIREQSAEGQGASFAGIAAGGKDLSSMFFNPATITQHAGRKFELNAAGIVPRSKLSNGAATNPLGAVLAGGNGGNIGTLAAVPASYGTMQLSPNLFVGLGINSPFGLVTKSDASSIVRFHAIKSDLITLNANPVVAYKVSPMISVALGAQVEYLNANLTNIVFPGGAETFADLEADGFGYGFTAGITFEPTPATRIGIGFRSAVKHKLDGDAKFSPAIGGALAKVGAKAQLTVPETLTIGLRHKVTPKFTALAGFEWANWSRFKELRVKFDGGALPDSVTDESWKDSYMYSLGGEYNYSEATIVRAGVAYEKSPVPDATRTPRVPDNDRLWLSAGFSHQWNDWISITGAYTHIFVKNASIDLTLAENPTRGTLTGTYKGSVDILTFSVNATF